MGGKMNHARYFSVLTPKKMNMMSITPQLKLELIQWILEAQNQDLLLALWNMKEQERKARQESAEAAFGAWQGDETADELIEMVYDARHDRNKDEELSL
jgi:hypothetical protein